MSLAQRYRRLAWLSAGAAVALAGCGGHAVTRNDVIARGNAICESAAQAVRSIAPPTGSSLVGLAGYYRRVTPIVDAEVKQLRSLPRPSPDRALLGRYLDAVASSARQYKALSTAAENGDRGQLASASAALRANPAATLAARYGIAGCAASPATSPS